MLKWEYKSVLIRTGDGGRSMAELNNEGQDYWEVCGVVAFGTEMVRVFLKSPWVAEDNGTKPQA
jgi:hypothetical protein